jgi:outer membrane protein assembly factor BamB
VAGIQLDPDWSSHPPRLVWQQEIGAGWSGFAAVNRSAVTLEQRGDLELITCYDVESGELNWSHSVNARHATTLGYVGPRSTPTIHQGRVYTLGATGVLTCLDGADGSVIWQRNLLQDHQLTIEDAEQAVPWGRAASPLVYQDIVIVPLGGALQGTKLALIAVDLIDGSTRWTGGNYQAAYSSPMLAVLGGIEQILIVNEDFVSAHDPSNGNVLWDHPWPGKSSMDANVSQPALVDDSHLFLSKGYGHGSELIEVRREQDEWVVQSVWHEKVMKTKFSNVALSDGHAYGLDDGILSCVDVWTGERKWKQGRYGYGQILMVENLLLVLSERGELALVEATPTRFHELGRIHALDGQTWNTLCLVGDRLLLRNAEMAACYQLSHEL